MKAHSNGYKKTLITICLTTAVLLIFITTGINAPVLAGPEIGGEVKVSLNAAVNEEDISTQLQESLNLELLLPGKGSSEARAEVEIFNPPVKDLSGDEMRYYFKKLYIKQRYPGVHLTMGRQPVSWSFGSLFNPTDFNPGAMVAGEETLAKYLDAVEGYFPLNWNSSIAVVAGYPDGFAADLEEIKWGLRGRTGYKGYDLTANYVQEPGNSSSRLGLTAKGDLGSIGVYGGASYHLKNPAGGEKLSYLLGVDYSFLYDYFKRITLQAEYLSLTNSQLALLGVYTPGQQLNTDRSRFVAGNINYPIDDFSSLGMVSVISVDDKSFILGPTYTNQLGNNLELTLSAMAGFGDKDSLFGPKVQMPGQGKTRGLIEMGLTYTF